MEPANGEHPYLSGVWTREISRETECLDEVTLCSNTEYRTVGV